MNDRPPGVPELARGLAEQIRDILRAYFRICSLDGHFRLHGIHPGKSRRDTHIDFPDPAARLILGFLDRFIDRLHEGVRIDPVVVKITVVHGDAGTDDITPLASVEFGHHRDDLVRSEIKRRNGLFHGTSTPDPGSCFAQKQNLAQSFTLL